VRPAADTGDATPKSQDTRNRIVVGLMCSPGSAADQGKLLEESLPAVLQARFSQAEWEVSSYVEPLAGPPSTDVDLVQLARRRMLDEGWNMAVCLTDLPIHVGRRPVTAHISVSLGIGVISVPALGAVAADLRLRQTVLRVIEGLAVEMERGRKSVSTEVWHRRSLRDRIQGIANPIGDAEVRKEDTVQFVSDAGRGNLRLVIGMVRENRPWRLIAGLSRALVAALGTAALTLTSPGVWRIANGLGWSRLVVLSIGAVAATCFLLIAVHGLLEPLPSQPEARHRVLLFNVATVSTIALGVIAHYVALFITALATGLVLIAPNVLGAELHHSASAADYIRLAWLVTSLGAIGGALGAAVESDQAVREAAYGYRPQDRQT
jgi:hypothetical protein